MISEKELLSMLRLKESRRCGSRLEVMAMMEIKDV
jgi:hypothetical protein